MATLTMPEAFLQDVIKHRDDDAPRLIFADWLEERGDPARAEFIRVQVALEKHEAAIAQWGDRFPAPPVPEGFLLFSRREALRRRERELLEAHGGDWLPLAWDAWEISDLGLTFATRGGPSGGATYRRGFVAKITCTLDAFYGGPCWLCGGRGGTDGLEKWDCPDCRGTGRTPGHGPALVRAAPIERVTLSDREPDHDVTHDVWVWWADQNDGDLGPAFRLPWAVFDCLQGGQCYAPSEKFWERGSRLFDRVYHSRAAARDAVSAALLAWARAQPVTS